MFNLASVTFSAIQTVMFGISYAISWIAGIFVILEAYVLQWILSLSFNIVNNSPIVQYGFPVMLSLANLLFVLGLIVIALATILHIESYGIKNVLWKLVVVAIAVNFGLIIAGTILNFADNITMFMVQSINPATSTGLNGFASNIAGAFNPQESFAFSAQKLAQSDVKDFQSAFNASAAEAGGFLSQILGVFLSIFGLAIILITLGATIVILLVRYIKVSFALLSLPIAWAVWPFPKFKSSASEWWSKFLKQAFYPIPLVFFIWLALITAQAMSKATSTLNFANLPNTGNALGAVIAVLGNFFTPVFQNFMRLVLLGGVMLMGLAAAEKMGATFAKTAQNALKAGGKKLRGNMQNRISNRAERVGRTMQQATAAPRAGLLQARSRLQKFNESFGGLKKDKRTEIGMDTETGTVAASNKIQTALLDRDGYFQDDHGTRLGGGRAVWDARNRDYRRNAAGNYVDASGKEILPSDTLQGFVALDNNGQVVMRNGKVQYLDKNGKLDGSYKTPDGKWHAYTDDKGELLSQPAAYRQSEYTAARAEMVRQGYVKDEKGRDVKAEDLRDAMRMQAKESAGILKAFVAEPIVEAMKKMGGSHGGLKEEDLKKFLEERGIHMEGGHAPPAPSGGGAPAPAAGGGHP